MNVEYREGKKIVTHESGHVDIYNIDDIEKKKTDILDRIVELQNRLKDVDNQLEQMRASAGIANPVPKPDNI